MLIVVFCELIEYNLKSLSVNIIQTYQSGWHMFVFKNLTCICYHPTISLPVASCH